MTETKTSVIDSKPASRFGSFRWIICALLLLGTTKNYMDRQILGVLKDTLQHALGWNEIDYSNLVFAFQAAYAIGLLLVGRFIDRVGTRLGYAAAMIFWSFASIGHAFAHSLTDFIAARFALGLGESAVFPASIKSVAEWFPAEERALATGIFNAGTNIGAILTPLTIPWITIRWGWRAGFVFTGSLGFAWVLLWLLLYRKPGTPQAQARVKWMGLLSHRQTWAFVAGKFMTDPIWWFYLFWIPDFLQRKHSLKLTQIVVPIVVIYLISDVGSVAGGWFSFVLIQRGKTVNAARKIAMLVCAVCVLPIIYAYRASGLWTAVLLIGLAAAAHQGFSCNLFTLSSDMFPSSAVGSVVGIGGMAGAIGGMLIAKIVGYVLQWTESYMIPFFIAGVAYLIALGLIQLLAPSLAPASLSQEQSLRSEI